MAPRKLSLEDLAAARQLYERDGLTYQALADRFGVGKATIRPLLVAVGRASRPVGWPQRPRPALPAEQPQPSPAAAIRYDFTGRLRIPCRSAAERRVRVWTSAELQAIEVELAAGRMQRVRRGRSGLPERPSIWQRQAAEISFYRALQRVKQAA
jgi:hypothetical protein